MGGSQSGFCVIFKVVSNLEVQNVWKPLGQRNHEVV